MEKLKRKMKELEANKVLEELQSRDCLENIKRYKDELEIIKFQ